MKFYKVFYWIKGKFTFLMTEVPAIEGAEQAIFNITEYFRVKGEEIRISHASLYFDPYSN